MKSPVCYTRIIKYLILCLLLSVSLTKTSITWADYDPNDLDSDGILNDVDNCPNVANSDQRDTDYDHIGDLCDQDIDGDNLSNAADNCLAVANFSQHDLDSDGIGDACDYDRDGDGVGNDYEEMLSYYDSQLGGYVNDPDNGATSPVDTDGDGVPDIYDETISNFSKANLCYHTFPRIMSSNAKADESVDGSYGIVLSAYSHLFDNSPLLTEAGQVKNIPGSTFDKRHCGNFNYTFGNLYDPRAVCTAEPDESKHVHTKLNLPEWSYSVDNPLPKVLRLKSQTPLELTNKTIGNQDKPLLMNRLVIPDGDMYFIGGSGPHYIKHLQMGWYSDLFVKEGADVYIETADLGAGHANIRVFGDGTGTARIFFLGGYRQTTSGVTGDAAFVQNTDPITGVCNLDPNNQDPAVEKFSNSATCSCIMRPIPSTCPLDSEGDPILNDPGCSKKPHYRDNDEDSDPLNLNNIAILNPITNQTFTNTCPQLDPITKDPVLLPGTAQDLGYAYRRFKSGIKNYWNFGMPNYYERWAPKRPQQLLLLSYGDIDYDRMLSSAYVYGQSTVTMGYYANFYGSLTAKKSVLGIHGEARAYISAPTPATVDFGTLCDIDKDGIYDGKDDDQDGDGFSNAEELASNTDPRNPESSPGMM